MEEEYERAKNEVSGFLLQGDLNAWLGPNVLPGDTKLQDQNGKHLVKFVDTNKLTIENTLTICLGAITWSRKRNRKQMSSTRDFYVVCGRVLPCVQEMAIVTNTKHKITNFKQGDKTTEGDHVPFTLKMNI